MNLELPDLPTKVKLAIGCATHSLFYGGPFEVPVAIVNEWAEDIHDAYFDEEGYRQDFEAFESGEAFLVDRRDILRQYVGKELLPYVI